MLIALLMLFFSEVQNNTVRETNQAFPCFISRPLLFRTAACFELRNGGHAPLEASTSFVGQKILLPQTALLRQHFLNFSFSEICSGSCSETLKGNAELDSTLSVSFMHFGLYRVELVLEYFSFTTGVKGRERWHTETLFFVGMCSNWMQNKSVCYELKITCCNGHLHNIYCQPIRAQNIIANKTLYK